MAEGTTDPTNATDGNGYVDDADESPPASELPVDSSDDVMTKTSLPEATDTDATIVPPKATEAADTIAPLEVTDTGGMIAHLEVTDTAAAPPEDVEIATQHNETIHLLVLNPSSAVLDVVDAIEPSHDLEKHDILPNTDAACPSIQSDDECGQTGKTTHFTCCRPLVARWKAVTDDLRKSICRGVLAVTHQAALHPYKCLIGITVFSLALLGIGFATNFDMNVSASESYTDQNSILRLRKEWVHHIADFSSQPISIRAVIHANGNSVLTQTGVERAFQVVETVKHTPGYDAFCSPKHRYHYTDEDIHVGGGYGTKCHVRGITMLWNNSLSAMQEQVKSDGDVWIAVAAEKYPDGSEVDSREILGRPRHHYKDISGAESLLMEVMIPSMFEHSIELREEVLNRMLDLRQEWQEEYESHGLRLEVFTNSALEAETTRAVMKDLPLIALVFVVMAVFTCLIFSSNNGGDAVDGSQKSTSRVLLGLGAVVCVVLSLATSYGLLYIIGVPFTSITQILPFVMFGIGLDDAFIIFGEFNRTDRRKDPVERIHDTFEEVGLSIVLTKVTTTMAFALGCCSDIPTLYWLSLYAFPTVMVDAVYQVTFFVAVVVLDERRVEANRKDCCICWTRDPTDGTNAPDDGSLMASSLASSSFASSCTVPISSNKTEADVSDMTDEKLALKTKPYQQPRSCVDRLMGWYSNQLVRPSVKTFVLWAFLAMTIGLAYSTTKFTQEFEVLDMLPEDSFIRDYLIAMSNHGESFWIIPSAYFSGVDQSDPHIQDQMEAYINDLVSMSSMTDQPPFFWLRHFRDFLTYDDRLLEMSFNEQMDIFLSIDHFRLLYGDHIMRDLETGDVIASRCVLYMDNVELNSVQSQIEAWKDQRDVTFMQPINAGSDEAMQNFFLYEEDMFYIWEFYDGTVGELIANSILGVLVVCVIGLILIPHWTATLYMLPIISVLIIDMIGFLQLFQVHLNAVSYFSLIMSIGLLVDFNMHILLRYYESPCATREGKVKDALQTMGSSVLIGGFSTFLGVLPLFFSSSELMQTLFYGFIGMVLLGCGHGLILLPVILSIFGPVDTVGTRNQAINDSKMLTVQLSMSTSYHSEESTPTGCTSSTCSKPHSSSNASLWISPHTYPDASIGQDDVVESESCAPRAESDAPDQPTQGDDKASTGNEGEHGDVTRGEEEEDELACQGDAMGSPVVLQTTEEDLKSTLDDCVLLPAEEAGEQVEGEDISPGLELHDESKSLPEKTDESGASAQEASVSSLHADEVSSPTPTPEAVEDEESRQETEDETDKEEITEATTVLPDTGLQPDSLTLPTINPNPEGPTESPVNPPSEQLADDRPCDDKEIAQDDTRTTQDEGGTAQDEDTTQDKDNVQDEGTAQDEDTAQNEDNAQDDAVLEISGDAGGAGGKDTNAEDVHGGNHLVESSGVLEQKEDAISTVLENSSTHGDTASSHNDEVEIGEGDHVDDPLSR